MENIRDLLGRKYTIDVLIYVYENPGAMQKTIIEATNKGRAARLDRLKDLVNAKLITEKSSGIDWTAITYHVTEEGTRIARGLLNIEQGGDTATDHSTPQIEGNTLKS